MLSTIVVIVIITGFLFVIQCVIEGNRAQQKGKEKADAEALKAKRREQALANLRK